MNIFNTMIIFATASGLFMLCFGILFSKYPREGRFLNLKNMLSIETLSSSRPIKPILDFLTRNKSSRLYKISWKVISTIGNQFKCTSTVYAENYFCTAVAGLGWLPGGGRTSRGQLAGLAAVEGARSVPLGLLTEQEARELLAGRLGAGRVRRTRRPWPSSSGCAHGCRWRWPLPPRGPPPAPSTRSRTWPRNCVLSGGRWTSWISLIRIHGLLGEGGMALVYDGFDQRLERPVAGEDPQAPDAGASEHVQTVPAGGEDRRSARPSQHRRRLGLRGG